MSIIKRILDFYIGASLHVAVAVFALVKMTQHMFGIDGHDAMAGFAFFATVAGYNFVKYHTLVLRGPVRLTAWTGSMVAVSAISLVLAGCHFLDIGLAAQAATAIFAALTVLYTLPFFPNRRNARNWAGVKIYIVALCWVGVTVALPLLDAGMAFTADFWFKCLQRFILIFVLILVFEIVDLEKDDPLLQTVPQQIGVRATKWLGISLLLVFFLLELLQSVAPERQWTANLLLVLLAGAFLLGAHEKRSRYYSAFWAEAIPIAWYFLVIMLKM